MRFFVGLLAGMALGCAGLYGSYRYSLQSLSVREWTLAVSYKGELICSSSRLNISTQGEFESSDYRQYKGIDKCLSVPLFGYSAQDKAKLQAYIESVAAAYYAEK